MDNCTNENVNDDSRKGLDDGAASNGAMIDVILNESEERIEADLGPCSGSSSVATLQALILRRLELAPVLALALALMFASVLALTLRERWLLPPAPILVPK